MYGFSQPYQFRSVLELIQYHKTVTLKQYNKDLDICLKHPATRTVDVCFFDDLVFSTCLVNKSESIFHLQVNMGDVYTQLEEIHEKVVHGSNQLENILDEFNKRQQVA